MLRSELADFLRRSRARVRPADVGLQPGRRRRTPGLRREEVAWMAGVSVDYYNRLEQARGPHPSRQTLSGIAGALRLSDDERAHLFHLAGEPPAVPDNPVEVPAGIMRMLDGLKETPALVLDAKYEVLAWNPLAAALISASAESAPDGRNLILRYFTGAEPSWVYDSAGMRSFAHACVADLRAAAARHPDDQGIATLVADLVQCSTEFRRLWDGHTVGVQRCMGKQIKHPLAGDIEVECQVLQVPDRELRVVLYTAMPGTPSRRALDSLMKPGGGPSEETSGR